MRRIWLSLIALFLLSATSQAQTLKGSLYDKGATPNAEFIAAMQSGGLSSSPYADYFRPKTTQPVACGSGQKGRVWFDSTLNVGKLCNGTAWQQLTTSGSSFPASNSQGDILYGSASNVYSNLAKDANATRYLSNTGASNNPAWAQVNLANGVTGSLPETSLSFTDVTTNDASATKHGFLPKLPNDATKFLDGTGAFSTVTSAPFVDTTTIVKGSGDATKLLRFEVDGFTAGATRVVTPPDANTSLWISSFNHTVAGPTAARIFTFPDASTTIVGLTDTQALTNKTVNGNTFTTGTYTLTGAASKTLTFNNTLTLSGTDGSTVNVGAGGTLGSNAFTSTTIPTANSTTSFLPYLSSANTFSDSNIYQGTNLTRITNGTNAQRLEVYATTDSASTPANYERLSVMFNGSSFLLLVDNAGTGSNARNLVLGSGNTGSLFLGSGTNYWKIPGNTGHFLANIDNTYDIGASGATRPRTGYFGTSVSAPSVLATTSVTIGGGTAILKHLSATATLDFANLAAIGCENLTITVTGAALGDTVAIGVPNGSVVTNGTFFGWVSAADTVSIKFCTVVSGDPASGTFRADVTQH